MNPEIDVSLVLTGVNQNRVDVDVQPVVAHEMAGSLLLI